MPTVWFIGVLAVCHQFPTAGHSVRWWIWFWSVFSGHVVLRAGSVRSFCWVGFWVLALDFGETHTSVGLSVGFYGGRYCCGDASGCLGWWFLEEICVDKVLLR
jgi:hypothetical protein